MLECTTQTTVAEIKARALAAAKTEGTVALPAADGSSDDSLESAASAAAQELIFLGQICRDDKTLAGEKQGADGSCADGRQLLYISVLIRCLPLLPSLLTLCLL